MAPGPALTWVAAFVFCVAADALLLGRWVLLPVFVAGFYAGVVAIELVAYPLLGRWRSWLRPRGVRAWYLIIGGLWAGPAIVLALVAPWWLDWGWGGALLLQVVGTLVLVLSVGIGAWAMGTMGWARLLLAPSLFPPEAGEDEDRIPRGLVVKGPYRYVRHPLYGTDLGVILGTALLAREWALVVLAVAYAAQLGAQLYLEEQELEARFGEAYVRYRRLVPRFIPHLKPVDPAEVYGAGRANSPFRE